MSRAVRLGLVGCALLALACATTQPSAGTPPSVAPNDEPDLESTTAAPTDDPLAACQIVPDEERKGVAKFDCEGVRGAVDTEVDDPLLVESRRLREAVGGGRDGARFFLLDLPDVTGTTDSFRFERGAEGGVVAVRRADGRTRSATCLFDKADDGARARCTRLVARALGDDERFRPPESAEEEEGSAMVIDLKEPTEAMGVDAALDEYGSGCDVEKRPGLYMLDCHDKLLAILVGHKAPKEATPEDLIRAMRRTGSDGDDVQFELFDGEVKTARGTVSAKRFTAEDDKDKGGGIIVSDGLNDELRFMLCVWKDGGGREQRCTSLVGALLR